MLCFCLKLSQANQFVFINYGFAFFRGTRSFTRRSCQTVVAAQLFGVTRIMAPILPHLAEDVWQNLPFPYTNHLKRDCRFVFESGWPSPNAKWLHLCSEDIDFWAKILDVRTEVNKVLEVARAGKLIGSSLDAKVTVFTKDPNLCSRLRQMCASTNEADNLHRIFITSQAEVVDELEEGAAAYKGECEVKGGIQVWIGVSRAEGLKCERCWNYSPRVATFLDHPTLCARCHNVVVSIQTPATATATHS